MKFLLGIAVSLYFLLSLCVNVAVAEDESLESVLKKFKLMQNASKQSTSKQNTDHIIKTKKSNLTRNKIQNLLNSAKNSNQPINLVELLGHDFSGLNLSGLDFSNAIMYRVNFSNSNLDNCTFGETFLEGANFSNTSLKGATFIIANVSRSNFTKAN